MKLNLPKPELLKNTGPVDYFEWNYKFPIKYIQRYRFHAIMRMIGPSRYSRILEAGIGSGVFLPTLASYCDDLYGIDIHGFMPDVERMCQLTSTKATLAVAALEKTPFPNSFFDLVVAVSVLEFVDDLDMSIREIKRILKKDGFLITICPRDNPLTDIILHLYTRRPPETEFKNSRKEIYRKLEHEFRVISKKVFPPLFSSIFPIYNCYKLGKRYDESNHL